jgi:hypothetical protein
MNKTHATKNTAPLSLASSSLCAIWQAFFIKPSPDFWSERSEEEVAALQRRCESHWVTRTSPLLRSFKFRGAVALLAGMLLCFLTQGAGLRGYTPVDVVLTGILLVAAGTLGAAVAIAIATVAHEQYAWGVVADIAAQLSPLHNTKDAHQHAMRMLKRSASGAAYRDTITSMGRELRLVDRDVLRGIDWLEQEALGRRMPPLRPPHWHEYYYRLVPRPKTPQGGSTGSQPSAP